MDIKKYIIENSSNLFEPDWVKPVHVDVNQERHTSMVYFCHVHFDSGISKRILIKTYDDQVKTRVHSLYKEFNFSKNHYQTFNSDEIGIPKPIYFDVDNELIVMEYIDQSKTLEETLLQTHNIFNNSELGDLFFNAGRWIARFHSINQSSKKYEISIKSLSNEIKGKWLQTFENKQEISDEISLLITNALSEDHVIDLSGLHKEFAPGNILHVNNKIYGVDFGSREDGCILDDVAYFIIATLVLNNFPKYPFFERVQCNSQELKRFYEGYSTEYDIDINIFSSHLFAFFLYKNLIRRISGQLLKTDQYPKIVRYLLKAYITNFFYRTKKIIFPDLPRK